MLINKAYKLKNLKILTILMMDGNLSNLFQYIDIYFEEEFKDYSVNPNIITNKKVPIKWCT